LRPTPCMNLSIQNLKRSAAYLILMPRLHLHRKRAVVKRPRITFQLKANG
jgi:hypothetical protein